MGLATEQLFNTNSDLNNPLTSGVSFVLVTAPLEEPLTLGEAKDNLRIKNTRSDALITRIIAAARQWIELVTGQMMIEQTWRQTHNNTGSLLTGQAGHAIPFARGTSVVDLHIEPVRSIVSVKVFATLQSTTQTTVPATDYFFTGQQLVPRSVWPSTRGIGGFEVEYKVGHGADKADFAAASRALPLRRALDMLVAYLFENPGDAVMRESRGGGTTALRSLPPEVDVFLDTFVRYEL